MAKNLVVSLIQSSLHWEDVGKNLQMFTEKFQNEELNGSDLIILPEMFNTGFTMKSELFAESMDGKTVSWMREMAAQKNAVVAGSLIIKSEGKNYNRLVWMLPDGVVHFYDKRHLFRMAGENEHFSPGKERVIFNIKGWRICPLICYDLRFPIWSRNSNNFDLLFYVANWPERRSHAWRSLLVARAIENLCYVAAVNRVGTDGKEVLFSGDSAIIDFRGEYLATTIPHVEEVLKMELSLDDLLSFRASFPAHLDADDYEIMEMKD
jgi:omega-amidase